MNWVPHVYAILMAIMIYFTGEWKNKYDFSRPKFSSICAYLHAALIIMFGVCGGMELYHLAHGG